MDDTALLHEVREIRRELPRLGVRKLQVMLYQRGHDVGCDRLFDLLREAGMLVSRKRFRARTTDSRHWMRKWDNLIRDVCVVLKIVYRRCIEEALMSASARGGHYRPAG